MDWSQELCISAFKSFAGQKIATKITYARYRESAMRQTSGLLVVKSATAAITTVIFQKG